MAASKLQVWRQVNNTTDYLELAASKQQVWRQVNYKHYGETIWSKYIGQYSHILKNTKSYGETIWSKYIGQLITKHIDNEL